jgi:hypothetical protein
MGNLRVCISSLAVLCSLYVVLKPVDANQGEWISCLASSRTHPVLKLCPLLIESH